MTTSTVHRSLRHGLAASLLTVLAASSFAVVPAGALGNGTLNAQLVAPAGPGWKPYSAATSQNLVNTISSSENISIALLHGHASVAAQLWNRGPGRSLQIALIAVTSSLQPNKKLESAVQTSARLSARSFCQGTVGKLPEQTGTIRTIPNSVVGECPLVSGKRFIIVAWVKANVLAIIATTLSAMNLKEVVDLSHREYQAMSTSAFTLSSSSSTSSILLVALGALVVAGLLGAGATAYAKSRRRTTPTALASTNVTPVPDSAGDAETDLSPEPPTF